MGCPGLKRQQGAAGQHWWLKGRLPGGLGDGSTIRIEAGWKPSAHDLGRGLSGVAVAVGCGHGPPVCRDGQGKISNCVLDNLLEANKKKNGASERSRVRHGRKALCKICLSNR